MNPLCLYSVNGGMTTRRDLRKGCAMCIHCILHSQPHMNTEQWYTRTLKNSYAWWVTLQSDHTALQWHGLCHTSPDKPQNSTFLDEPQHPSMSHNISRWATTFLDEPQHRLVSHPISWLTTTQHIARCTTTFLDEPQYFSKSHNISRWATSSLDEPHHL